MKQKVAELEREGHKIIKVTAHQITFKDKDTSELRTIYRLCFSQLSSLK